MKGFILHLLSIESEIKMPEYCFYVHDVNLFVVFQLDETERGQQIQVKVADMQEKFLGVDSTWLEILRFVDFKDKVSNTFKSTVYFKLFLYHLFYAL